MKSLTATVWGGLLLLVAGCASPDAQRSQAAGPPPRDRVLYDYRQGVAALRAGQFPAAKESLDRALAVVGGIMGPDRDARKSRGMFHRESRKTFIGEPYERVMAYFYRGILYWMDGEPDNARACFRSAQLQDSGATQKEYANDWVLMDYLDGLVTAKLAGDGSDALKRAWAESRQARPPAYNPQANVLFFAEFGHGPTKYATGEYQEQLRFHPGNSVCTSVRVTVGGQTLVMPGYDNVSFQAMTRGGRLMDHVLGNKAVFKSATDALGDAAIISGAVLAASQHGRRSGADEVGAGLMVFGLASKILSAATTPAADTRAWDSLPEWISFGALQLPAGTYQAHVEFLGPGGGPMVTTTRDFRLEINDPRRDLVVFLSDKSP